MLVEPSRLLAAWAREPVPGFALRVTRFTPHSSAAAPRPKFLDQACHGISVQITDTTAAQPYRLGLTLLAALAQHDGFEWRRDGEALTWLLGNPRIYRDLRGGLSVESILAADEADHAAWRRDRRSVWLY